MKSTQSNHFSKAPQADIQRSSFDRSHGYKTTFDAGYLIPFLVDDCLPGDSFNVSVTAFARLATPIHPIMDNMTLDMQFFAIPWRLVWDNFEKFHGEQDNPADSTDFLIPSMTSDGYANESIFDYMGLPTQTVGYEHNSLLLRCYNKTWNQWYRDENLQDSVIERKTDGGDIPADFKLLRRGKRRDYFTSALPWPQKGDSVSLPLGQTAPIMGIDQDTRVFNITDTANRVMQLDTTAAVITTGTPSAKDDLRWATDPASIGLVVDLSAATAATINQLRESFQIQRLLERDARGGTRYTEIVVSHFGVHSPDSRLQRVEFLGSGSTPVNVSPIAQTSETDATTPQGNLAAMGTVGVRNNGFTKSFTEHTFILGLMSVRADLTYQQGLNRMWSKQTRYDTYYPALSHLGEQAILNQEIYTQGSGNPTADAAVFGYQERYAEYRYFPSQITGKFRSNDALSLDAWHLAQEFGTLPVLDDLFIQETPPLDRVIAVTDEPHFLFDSYISMQCARPMPMYAVPGLIDHF